MGKRIYFIDNLRTFLIFLIVFIDAAMGFMIFPPYHPYVLEGAAESGQRLFAFDVFVSWGSTFAVPILFFISGYFGASSLRVRLFKPFFLKKWQRLGWPWVFGSLFLAPQLAYLAYLNEDDTLDFLGFYMTHFWTDWYEQGPFWFLGLLLGMFGCLMAAKKLRPHCLQKKPADKPSFVLLSCIFLFSAFATFWMDLICSTIWIHPLKLLVFQPVHLANYIIYFAFGVYAFRHRWFTPQNYCPSMKWLVPFILLSILHLGHVIPTAPTFVSLFYVWALPLIYSGMILTGLLGLIGLFSAHITSSGPSALTLSLFSYPIYFLHQTLIQNTAWFLRPLEIPGFLKYIVICALALIYAYMLSKYILLRLSSFKRP